MCKRPDIIVLNRRSATYRYDNSEMETFVHDFTAASTEYEAIARTPRNTTFVGWYLYYWCDNCERAATMCPICRVRRCDNEIISTMIGHWPLACTTCRPDGVKQSFEMGMEGPYAGGNVLHIEDDEVRARFTGPSLGRVAGRHRDYHAHSQQPTHLQARLSISPMHQMPLQTNRVF